MSETPFDRAQDHIFEQIESIFPETEQNSDRVERVLGGVSTNLNDAGMHPEVATFLAIVHDNSKSVFPITWEYVTIILESTAEGDSYRDEASAMLRFTMGSEPRLPLFNDLPFTGNDVIDKARSNAIAEIHTWARNARVSTFENE